MKDHLPRHDHLWDELHADAVKAIRQVAIFLCFMGLVGLLGLYFLILMGQPAKAHDAPSGWSYPFACCSNQDCRALPEGAVKEGPMAYTVPSGEEIDYRDERVRVSPDGLWHWCTVAGENTGRTICLFAPPRAF